MLITQELRARYTIYNSFLLKNNKKLEQKKQTLSTFLLQMHNNEAQDLQLSIKDILRSDGWNDVKSGVKKDKTHIQLN